MEIPQSSTGGATTTKIDTTEYIVPRGNRTFFQQLPQFSIRNGDPSDVKSLLLKPTIPTAYNWVPIVGLEPEDSKKVIDAYIKSEMSHLVSNPPDNLTESQTRKAAIVLGTARAVSTAMYKLSPSDFIPGEVSTPQMIAEKSEDGELTYKVLPSLQRDTTLTEPLTLSKTEQAAVSQLILCSTGLLPMQGYSLIMTGHHYLRDAGSPSRKVYAVVEKAYMKGVAVGDWFSSDLYLIQDILWHKAGHPVSVSLKMQLATDAKVAIMVRDAGAGACASRLPAFELELRAANSHIKLLSKVAPMFEIFGGHIDFELLVETTEYTKRFPVGVNNPTMPADTPRSWPADVKNRHSALAYLGDVLKRNRDIVAYCYGFYCALSESSQTLGSAGAVDTLRTSHSLAKLKTQSYPSFFAGTQAFGDYAAAKNVMRAASK